MSEPKTNECTGHCCARFTLKKGAIKKFKAYEPEGEFDIRQGMLKFVGYNTEHGGLPSEWNYSCNYWDSETRLCTAYEHRPKMCSEYPYDGICGVCGMKGPRAPEEGAQTVWCCSMHQNEFEVKT